MVNPWTASVGFPDPVAVLGLGSIPGAQYGVAVISVVLVVVCVLLHYEVLRKLSDWLDRMRSLHRTRVLVLILGLIATHICEIWVYSLGYGMLDGVAGFGGIAKVASPAAATEWLDYIYFSFVTYTTVGYGDLVPEGPIRFIAATEALNGWVLLGWSASFTFLEMQRFWRGAKA
jgi:Ion channel